MLSLALALGFGATLAVSAGCTSQPALPPTAPPQTTPSPPVSADPAVTRGKAVYDRRCAYCHSTGVETRNAPGLKDISRRNIVAIGKPATDETLRIWIRVGGSGPTGTMPGFGEIITEEELNDLIAYLKTL